MASSRTSTSIKGKTPIKGATTTSSKTTFTPSTKTTKRGGTVEYLSPTVTVYRLTPQEQAERAIEQEAQSRLKRKTTIISSITGEVLQEGTSISPVSEAQIATGNIKIYQRPTEIIKGKRTVLKGFEDVPTSQLNEVTRRISASGTAIVSPTVSGTLMEAERRRRETVSKRLDGARVYEKVGEVQTGGGTISSPQDVLLETKKSYPIKGREITYELQPVEKLTEKSKPGLITPKITRVLTDVQVEPKPLFSQKERAVQYFSEPVAFIGTGEGIPVSVLATQYDIPELKGYQLSATQKAVLGIETRPVEAIKAPTTTTGKIFDFLTVGRSRERFEKESEAILKRQQEFYQSEAYQRTQTTGKIIGAGLRASLKYPTTIGLEDKKSILEEYRSEREDGGFITDTLIGGTTGFVGSVPTLGITSAQKTILLGRGVAGGVLTPKDLFVGFFGIGAKPKILETATSGEKLIASTLGRVGTGSVVGTSPLDPAVKRTLDIRYKEGKTTAIGAGIGAFFVAGGIISAKRQTPIKTPTDVKLSKVSPQSFDQYVKKTGLSLESIKKGEIVAKGGDVARAIRQVPKQSRLIYEFGKSKEGISVGRVTDPLTGKSTTILSQGSKITKIISKPVAQKPGLFDRYFIKSQPIRQQTFVYESLGGKIISKPVTKYQLPFRLEKQTFVKPQKITGTSQTFIQKSALKLGKGGFRIEQNLLSFKPKAFTRPGAIEIESGRFLLEQKKTTQSYLNQRQTRLLQQQTDNAVVADIIKFKIGKSYQTIRQTSKATRIITQEARVSGRAYGEVGKIVKIGGKTFKEDVFGKSALPRLKLGEYKPPKTFFKYTEPKPYIKGDQIGSYIEYGYFKGGKVTFQSPPGSAQGIPSDFGSSNLFGTIKYPAVYKLRQTIQISPSKAPSIFSPADIAKQTKNFLKTQAKISTTKEGKSIPTLSFETAKKQPIVPTGKTRPVPSYFARDKRFGSYTQLETVKEAPKLTGQRPIIEILPIKAPTFKPLEAVPRFKIAPIISPAFRNISVLTPISTALSISAITAQRPVADVFTQRKVTTTSVSKILNIQKPSATIREISILTPTQILTPALTMREVSAVAQKQTTPQTTREITRQTQTPTGQFIPQIPVIDIPTPIPPGEPPIEIPGILPPFNFGGSSDPLFGTKRKKSKRGFKYKPTIKSIFLNIRAKIPKGQLSGFEERPLPLRGLI